VVEVFVTTLPVASIHLQRLRVQERVAKERVSRLRMRQGNGVRGRYFPDLTRYQFDNIGLNYYRQWSGPRPSVLGQDPSETKIIGLGLGLAGLVLCCVEKHCLVTLVIIMILKETATFQLLFIVFLFCAWNITTVEINSGVHLLKS